MPNARLALTAAALAFELTHLAWELLHGGVASHHLLNRADLPAISNWCGLLLIPVLAWFLAGRLQQRIAAQGTGSRAIDAGFAGALAYGAALALAFATQFEAISFIFFALFAIGLLVPIYRAQYVLGFVLGMTFTFGAVLPTIIATVIAGFSALMHLIFRSLRRLVRNSRARPPTPLN